MVNGDYIFYTIIIIINSVFQYAPYKKGAKGTLADRARKLGLDDLATQVINVPHKEIYLGQYLRLSQDGKCRFYSVLCSYWKQEVRRINHKASFCSPISQTSRIHQVNMDTIVNNAEVDPLFLR